MLPGRRIVRTAAASAFRFGRSGRVPYLTLKSVLAQLADQIWQTGAERVGQLAIRGMHRKPYFSGVLRHANIYAPAIT